MDDDRDARTYWDRALPRARGCRGPCRPTPTRALGDALAHFGDLTVRSASSTSAAGRATTASCSSSHGAHVVAVDHSEVAIATLAAACTQRRHRRRIEPVAADAFDIDRLGTVRPASSASSSSTTSSRFPTSSLVCAPRPETVGSATSTRTTDAAGVLLWARAHLVGSVRDSAVRRPTRSSRSRPTNST